MPVTQKDIAQHLGVSQSLIGSALNGKGRVSEETRQRIEQAAQELGYDEFSNRDARALVARRHGTHVQTRVIGFVYDRCEINDFLGGGVYRGLRDGAEQYDYDLLNLIRVRKGATPDNSGVEYLDRRADGLIFFVPHGRDDLLRTLVDHHIPVAAIGRSVPSGVAHIRPDNKGMARAAVDYLAQRGHAKIGFLGGPRDDPDYEQRLRGFFEAMKEAGLNPSPRHLMAGIPGDEWGFEPEALKALAQSEVTAVVCGSDTLALGLWRVAEELGKQVPRDLSIFGMDDLQGASERGLTTLRLDFPSMGFAALEAVVKMIDGASAEDCGKVIEPTLVERTSVGTQVSEF